MGNISPIFVVTPQREWEIVLFSLENNQIIKTYKIAGGLLCASKIRWTKDGKNLAYATETNEFTANIWLQPVKDSPPRRITDFTAERIFDLD